MFGPDVDAAARAHALAEFPKESVGLVVGGVYLPVENVAPNPNEDFEAPKGAWTDHGKIEGVIHSHGPQHALAPSANDMRHQISTDIPWGITQCDGVAASPVLWWGDFRIDEPLLGRTFVHGVTDCYSAIRSWYWQNKQVKLLDFPRNDQWWSDGKDLYSEGFGRAGFKQISDSDARDGDVVLIDFRSKVPNHGGVLVEGGLLYHHLQNRLSAREPLGRWRSMISIWLRYEG